MQSQRPAQKFLCCSNPSGATNPSSTGTLMSPHMQESKQACSLGVIPKLEQFSIVCKCDAIPCSYY